MPLPQFVEECYAELNTGREWIDTGVSFPEDEDGSRVLVEDKAKIPEGVAKILLSRFEL